MKLALADQIAAKPQSGARIYQRLAQRLLDDMSSGRFAVGDRLLPERELSIEYNVSRPAVREALIALEVQGYIDVRVGSGAFVRKLPGQNDDPGFGITAFELTEARILFESEAAALAATHADEGELTQLAQLVDQIDAENLLPEVTENADRSFHLLIAKATRNAAIQLTIESLWQIRASSPECALLHSKARHAKVRPVVAEHAAILDSLRARDPAAAYAAMRAHLSAVMQYLLFATEEQAIEQARRSIASTKARFGEESMLMQIERGR
ncbi:MAG: FCD domain-containing protein [Sphingomonas fennica]